MVDEKNKPADKNKQKKMQENKQYKSVKQNVKHNSESESESTDALFWADQKARDIVERREFKYIKKEIPGFDKFTVKTSASLSGVLHIGRLSDTIRGDSVHKALKDYGVDTELIWVAEDMDPLRKVPKGVPANYENYLGMPVTDVPDPDGCHDSYAEHFVSKYFEVIDEFVDTDMKKYSMREEYKKGNFSVYIKKMLDNVDTVREILNKYRTNQLSEGWSPWTPICDKCGKIDTCKVKSFDGKKVHYSCEDYEFEKTIAKGCGYIGENDPKKCNGKLMWKSEWAAQWARWGVCTEGAGKEYQVPNSAFWVNAEIVERVLDYPSPEPIFYEHLLIDNVKMSASLGNVVYPHNWLEAATPQLLRYFYNKRLMRTRSFSWKDLSKFYDEYDNAARVYYGLERIENEKEEMQIKKLFMASQLSEIESPVNINFSHASLLAQVFTKDSDIVKSLKKTGHYDEKQHLSIFTRIKKARAWLEKYAPEEAKFTIQEKVPEITLAENLKSALREIPELVEKHHDEQSLFNGFYELIKKNNLTAKEFFGASYKILLNRDRGPKLATLLLSVDKDVIEKLFGKL